MANQSIAPVSQLSSIYSCVSPVSIFSGYDQKITQVQPTPQHMVTSISIILIFSNIVFVCLGCF